MCDEKFQRVLLVTCIHMMIYNSIQLKLVTCAIAANHPITNHNILSITCRTLGWIVGILLESYALVMPAPPSFSGNMHHRVHEGFYCCAFQPSERQTHTLCVCVCVCVDWCGLNLQITHYSALLQLRSGLGLSSHNTNTVFQCHQPYRRLSQMKW